MKISFSFITLLPLKGIRLWFKIYLKYYYIFLINLIMAKYNKIYIYKQMGDMVYLKSQGYITGQQKKDYVKVSISNF